MSVSRFLTTGKVSHFLADEEKNDILLIDDSDEETGEADSDLYMDGKKVIDKKEDSSDMPDMTKITYLVKKWMLYYQDMAFKLDDEGFPRHPLLGRDFNEEEKDRLNRIFQISMTYGSIERSCKSVFEYDSNGLLPLGQKVLNKLLERESFKDIFFGENKTVALFYHDFATLLPSEWLNDSVINTFFNLITKRSNDDNFKKNHPKAFRVWSFSSFFYTKFRMQEDIRSWTKNIDIFSCDLIFVPLHFNNSHWALGIIDFQKKCFEYCDSLFDNSGDFFANICLYVNQEHLRKRKSDFDFEGWTNQVKPCPQQTNSCDCGEFVCRFADYISCGRTLNDKSFDTYDMTYFRRRHALEMFNNKLFF